ncbi:MAG: addiction module protein [Bacteroidetes bacterium]|nr:addiction module protein [Bacteroidota bacterium]MCW5895809.1 addiction module protein [Bacteroidota bacterium]
MELTLEEMAMRLLGLPASSRAMLAERLIESLDETEDDEVERLWIQEAEVRLQSILEGKAKTRPADQVFREAREKLG